MDGRHGERHQHRQPAHPEPESRTRVQPRSGPRSGLPPRPRTRPARTTPAAGGGSAPPPGVAPAPRASRTHRGAPFAWTWGFCGA
ncbi:hypothetical protein NSERUTF1_2509 [Nocardia seriolae]|nr:hypothetical protein NSERUTF1_2509 [Nocardia seriolae]